MLVYRLFPLHDLPAYRYIRLHLQHRHTLYLQQFCNTPMLLPNWLYIRNHASYTLPVDRMLRHSRGLLISEDTGWRLYSLAIRHHLYHRKLPCSIDLLNRPCLLSSSRARRLCFCLQHDQYRHYKHALTDSCI